MEYKKKIEYAERMASELEGSKTTNDIKDELKAEGFYEPDIIAVLTSAKNILGEKYAPNIKALLLSDADVKNAESFKSLDKEILDKLIEEELQSFKVTEKNKIARLVSEGLEPTDIFQQVDSRFLSKAEAAEYIVRVGEAKTKNNGGVRIFNIVIGLGIIVITGVIFMGTGRLFFVLPFIGLGMIVKGLMHHEV